MVRCIIQAYEVESLLNFEAEFGAINYALVTRSEISGLVVAEVADCDYPTFLEAINFMR